MGSRMPKLGTSGSERSGIREDCRLLTFSLALEDSQATPAKLRKELSKLLGVGNSKRYLKFQVYEGYVYTTIDILEL
jgi:hypothetical protein